MRIVSVMAFLDVKGKTHAACYRVRAVKTWIYFRVGREGEHRLGYIQSEHRNFTYRSHVLFASIAQISGRFCVSGGHAATAEGSPRSDHLPFCLLWVPSRPTAVSQILPVLGLSRPGLQPLPRPLLETREELPGSWPRLSARRDTSV